MPKHESYKYDDSASIIFAEAQVTNTEQFTDSIDLTVATGAEVDFTFDGDNATDDLIITIYKSGANDFDGTEQAWKQAITVSSDGSQDKYHYTIPDLYGPGWYRFGMKSEGGTTTFTISATCYTWRRTDTKA